MKIELKRVFGNTTLVLSEDVDMACDAWPHIQAMTKLLNRAEEGPSLTSAELQDKRAAIMAQGGDGKPAQGASVNGGEHNLVEHSGLVDRFGTAWDARYHAANRSKTKQGKWKLRKNMNEAEMAAAIALYR